MVDKIRNFVAINQRHKILNNGGEWTPIYIVKLLQSNVSGAWVTQQGMT